MTATAADRARSRARNGNGHAPPDPTPSDGATRDVPMPCPYHRCPDLVDVIMSRAGEGFVEHTLGGRQLYRLRLGGVAMLTGAPGTGKTSQATGLGIEHARERGPVVYLSLEMDADELGARAVGIQCDASWEDVLCGRVIRESMVDALALPRFVVLDGDNATLAELERTVDALRVEYPDQPILVIIDYLQIVPGDEREIRARVAAAAQAVRRLTKKLRVVTLAISQPSRAAGRALSAGDLIGSDSMTAMAESAEIERAAYITLALGASSPEHEDGSRLIDLSIGKGRFGGGDRVVPVRFWGRSGRMRIDGDARPASEVKAERDGANSSAKRTAAEDLILSRVEKSREPLTREDIERFATGFGTKVRRAAVAGLESRGELVEVRVKKPRARGWKLWSPSKAAAAGIPLVGDAP